MRLELRVLSLALVASACDSNSSSTTKPPATESEPPPVVGETVPSTEEKPGLTTGGETGGEVEAEESRLPAGLSVSRADFLSRLGDDLSARAKSFQSHADSLVVAASAYCTSKSDADLEAAREKWKLAMGEWQHFEVFQLGPVAENAKALKYNIYAWPDPANYCNIDGEALKASKSDNYRLPPNNNRKGMQALEYLLFESGYAGRCDASSAVAQEWGGLTAGQKVEARCAYIKPVAQAVADHAAILAGSWGVPGDNYLTRLLGNELLEQQMIQSLYEGFFYVDLEVKNQKLAAPTGLDAKHCPTSPAPCPERAEFQFADFSRQAVDVNLKAMVDLFYGPDSEGREGGFSALVRGQGGKDMADRTEVQLAQLDKVLETDPGLNLSELLKIKGDEDCSKTAVSWLCKTRAIIRKLATDLKGEYSQILKVQAPAAAAGDND